MLQGSAPRPARSICRSSTARTRWLSRWTGHHLRHAPRPANPARAASPRRAQAGSRQRKSRPRSGRRRKVTVLLGGLVVVLALAAVGYFKLMPKTSHIVSAPATAGSFVKQGANATAKSLKHQDHDRRRRRREERRRGRVRAEEGSWRQGPADCRLHWRQPDRQRLGGRPDQRLHDEAARCGYDEPGQSRRAGRVRPGRQADARPSAHGPTATPSGLSCRPR